MRPVVTKATRGYSVAWNRGDAIFRATDANAASAADAWNNVGDYFSRLGCKETPEGIASHADSQAKVK